jgi:hypothetical protein
VPRDVLANVESEATSEDERRRLRLAATDLERRVLVR